MFSFYFIHCVYVELVLVLSVPHRFIFIAVFVCINVPCLLLLLLFFFSVLVKLSRDWCTIKNTECKWIQNAEKKNIEWVNFYCRQWMGWVKNETEYAVSNEDCWVVGKIFVKFSNIFSHQLCIQYQLIIILPKNEFHFVSPVMFACLLPSKLA